MYRRWNYNQRAHQYFSRYWLIATVILVAVGGFLAVYILRPRTINIPLVSNNGIHFDSSVTESEKQLITQEISSRHISFSSSDTVSAHTTLHSSGQPIIAVYVPVTGVYGVQQSVQSSELKQVINALPKSAKQAGDINDNSVSFIPVGQLTNTVKLLRLDDAYYLDDFTRGAVFRELQFDGPDSNVLKKISIQLPSKDTVLTMNQTGVTALTRLLMTKLSSVGSATYFSANMGSFLASADITHVSNEVSFKSDCTYSNTKFCAPPAMIDVLKASGVDVVELTGNHNNDLGAQYNVDTIKLYHQLGWGTFGGGITESEAAKPWITDNKGTKLALLGYNDADGPNSGVIARGANAGGNGFSFDKAKNDITKAKSDGYFTIVDVQYLECYAYPNGFVEYPECDGPIPNQQETFRTLIDDGADMVVGSSAHQPQTFEWYKGKPIYYGLGNLYFDQNRWPGTERGIILTHYFQNNTLLQTKLSPTVYDSAFQTRMMTAQESDYFLNRLKTARERLYFVRK